jgi:glycerol-3-phosphate dehydrogenase
MNRDDAMNRVRTRTDPWDVLVIGGGATGVGIAIDAANRGLSTVLCEAYDFGKGTSSRSTKLVHGGVRYLKQGNLSLVRDALRERGRLLENAPHLVRDLSFVIPCDHFWQRIFYGVGLKLYDLLAGRDRFGKSRMLNSKSTKERVNSLHAHHQGGGVLYHDGQFDDSRLLIHMVRTAQEQGACLLNYAPVTEFLRDEHQRISGAKIVDSEEGSTLAILARCVINATGPFCDHVRALDDAEQTPLVAASQGVHLVFARIFFPGDTALIVPKTSDGRVLFIIPWHDHVVVGTTDTPISSVPEEPTVKEEEIDFLLTTLSQYVSPAPQRSDVLSMFVGVRPLVQSAASITSTGTQSSKLSRDHRIVIDESGLITITGGKWTTYRKMAEDCVDQAIAAASLGVRACQTMDLALHGSVHRNISGMDLLNVDSAYGTDAEKIVELETREPHLATRFHPELPLRGSHVVFAVQHEMARTLEDVLARRSRSLFLNARATLTMAPAVATLMRKCLNKDDSWELQQLELFHAVADHFLPPTISSND